ncbi:hypothetical protein A9Q99_21135 [Gammaproteobacteria bacterium 45_16_T64]|nr:hypothetical protein A9Q99_21135 [Gammaproteobacteria bacterium 45_16_T64]
MGAYRTHKPNHSLGASSPWSFRCVIACLALFSSTLLASNNVETVALYTNESYPLGLHLQILEDKTNTLTIDNVTSLEYENRFDSNDQPIINIGVSTSTFWLKIALAYPKSYPNRDHQKQWYLEIGSVQLDIAELYFPKTNSTYDITSSDQRTPYSERSFIHTNSVFPITLTLGQNATLFVKLKKSSSITLDTTLWTPEGFARKVAVEEFIYGIFFGSMLALIAYNLFFVVSAKDRSYLYYVIYLCGITAFLMLEMGHGIIHIDRHIGNFSRKHILFVLWIPVISGVYFAKSFMNLEKNHPRINALFNIYLIVALASVLVLFVMPNYLTGSTWSTYYNSLFMPAFLSVFLYIWIQGNSNAKFFFAAWAFNISGLMVFAGVSSKILPATNLTLSITPIGILLESTIFSLALAHRIKTERAAALASDVKTMTYMSNYQSIFKNAREAMYKMSLTGTITDTNPAMVKLFGFQDQKELILHNKNFAEYIFIDRNQIIQLLDNGKTNNELLFRPHNGDKVWATHRSRVIYDRLERPTHIEGSIVNITQLKLKDIAIKEKKSEELRKTIAEESAKLKSEFLSSMNHEIRTPLSAIIGFSEALKMGKLSKTERQDAIELITYSGTTLLHVVNNILDFSKMEVDMLKIESIPINVVNLISEIRNEFRCEATTKGLKFDLIYRPPIPDTVLGDPTRISQVLINLCSNAIKFTETGSIILVVSWNSPENTLVFKVIDSGIGMSQKFRTDILKEFDQTDTPPTRQHGGSGLGLTISKKLALMMNGNIRVASASGKGSVFTFGVEVTLPTDVHWIKKQPQNLPEEPNNTLSTPVISGTVLLAEDNIVNQKLLSRILQKMGLSVIIADDGIQACDICENMSPDFILMDINMPNRDGIEATRYLRNLKYTIPIYALTAETSEREINVALNAGCDGFLTKPINRSLLLGTLTQHLGNKTITTHSSP